MPWLLTAAIRVYSRAGFVHKTASAALFCGSSMTSQLVGGRFLHTTPMPVLQQLALHSRSQRSLLTSCQAHNFERKVGGSAPLHNATPSIALGGGATSSSSSSTHPRPRPANRTRRPSNNTKGKSRPKRNSNNNNGVANDIISLTESSLMSSDDEETPELAKIMNAVVKVYCVHTEPNYSLPWQRKRQYSSTSSGFIISGNAGQRWILTNAHSVEYHSQVKVKRRGDDEKFIATVLAIGTECDIALLTVEDDAFWLGVKPIDFGQLPKLQDAVAVVGYPIGGDTISVTSGVVSRIEVTAYSHGNTDLLALQIDAPINSGNSGGPVFNAAGACVGIAFQSFAGSDAENIGYVIPTPVIDHFITDYMRNGDFTGFPALGVHWQRMESAALKAAYHMGPEQKGVLVRKVAPLTHASTLLRPGDIIMSFDDVQIASDGTVPFRTGERIAFSYLTSQKFTGEKARLKIMREGVMMDVDVELCLPSALVKPHLRGRDPSYMVVAGFVFTPLTEPYLDSEYGCEYGSDAPVKLLQELYFGEKRQSDQELVVLSQVLACDATLGYEDLNNIRVKKFNGEPVQNLRHLAEMVYNCSEKFLRFDLEYHEVVVLENKSAQDATAEILHDHSIPSLVSKDLIEVLPDHLKTKLPAEQLVAATVA